MKGTTRLILRKPYILIATIAITVLMATGCGSRDYPALPANPIEFHTSVFENPQNDSEEATFSSIEYSGRTYILYGTVKGRLKKSDIESCLGYIVQDGETLEDIRIYRLTADPDDNYLVECTMEGEMEQPHFLRAVDTVGEDIETPLFIDDMGYEFWQ